MWREVVTERGGKTKWLHDGGGGGGAASPGWPAGPITGTLLISSQRALCQKSDTVRALWTSPPFKSTRRAAVAHVMEAALFVWGSEGATLKHKQRDEPSLQLCAEIGWFGLKSLQRCAIIIKGKPDLMKPMCVSSPSFSSCRWHEDDMMKKLKQVKSATEEVNWRMERELRWVGVYCPTSPPLLLSSTPTQKKTLCSSSRASTESRWFIAQF